MTIKPQRVHGKLRWRVTWRANGRTIRKYLKTQEQAKTFAADKKDDLRRLGGEWECLDVPTRSELLEAQRRAKERGYSVLEACRYWEQTRPTASGLKLSELVDKCLSAKRAKGLRPESLRVFGVTLEQFSQGREDRIAADIDSTEIAEWVASQEDWGPYRRRGAITDLRTLFGWGVKMGLLTANPASRVEKPIVDGAAPGIFSPERCRDLLNLTRTQYPTCLPYVALCLFAGVRPAEVERLTWESIDTERGLITVAVEQSKTRAKRLVPIHPTLAAWLAVCKRKPIVTPTIKDKLKDLRAAFVPWPRDVLRHSWVSYELARTNDTKGTALAAGHTEEMLFRHYRELVTPQSAAAFWAILPK